MSKNKSKTQPKTQEMEKEKDKEIKPISIFGNWTGKTPLSLLHEHCQKNGWMKPLFIMQSLKQGHSCTVHLSKKDGGNVKKVFIKSDQTFASEQEAKHSAATYALHRICSHLSLRLLLPPTQRDVWDSCEVTRKEMDPTKAKEIYKPDPFVNSVSNLTSSLKSFKSLSCTNVGGSGSIKSVSHSRDSLSSTSSTSVIKPRTLPSVHLSTNLRHQVESLIRTLGTQFTSKTDSKDIQVNDKTIQSLLKKGFRQAHVQEATLYCQSAQQMLHWLLIHVPEDDLPEQFMHKTSREIRLQQHDQESLKLEYILKRLLKTGIPMSLCRQALEKCHGDEFKTIQFLTRQLLESLLTPLKKDSSVSELAIELDVDLEMERNEEQETLSSIYQEGFSMELSENGRKWSIQSCSTMFLCIYIPHSSTYPFEIPGLMIQDDTLPCYIKLGILKELLKQTQGLVGTPMVFTLVCILQETRESLVSKPPLLMSLSHLFSTMSLDSVEPRYSLDSSLEESLDSHTSLQTQTKRLHHPRNVQQLYNEFKTRESSPKYQEIMSRRIKLPSFEYKSIILNKIKEHPVLVLSGETGCGKSTQIGQFILESCINSMEPCFIYCTQPRRLSATSLASRVSDEQCTKLGDLIGYKIRGESCCNSRTIFTFVTTGVLLRMIQMDPSSLKNISHIILDEVHERSIEMDLLLALLKEFKQSPSSFTFKLILMSATVDSDLFSNYFTIDKSLPCPSLTIPGLTFPVTDYYYEDYIHLLYSHYSQLSQESKTSLGVGMRVENDMEHGKKDIYSLINRLVLYICNEYNQNNTNDNEGNGGILIFLPGIYEINKCISNLQELNLPNVTILPLYANLSPKQQYQVFEKSRKRKIIVSTNVAETSITIDDIVYVIDSGKVKEIQVENGITSLVETWTSKSSCRQRRGRAGRTQPGTCFKLFTRKLQDKEMLSNSLPEICRLPLEQTLLLILSMGYSQVDVFLKKLLSPPDTSCIHDALSKLKQMNAIDSNSGLTPLGKHLASFPTDLRIAKILIFGSILGVLDSILTISSIMSIGKPLALGNNSKEIPNIGQSDWLSLGQLYEFYINSKSKHNFCKENGLSLDLMTQVESNRRHYLETLLDLGYIPKDYKSSPTDLRISEIYKEYNVNSLDLKVVKAALVAGLYPNVLTIKYPQVKYTETAQGSFPVDPSANEFRFYDEQERVYIHPGSVNKSLSKYNNSLLIYYQKMKTRQVFARDTTLVSCWPVLLFGGTITSIDTSKNIITMDNHIKIQAFPRIGVLIDGLKKLLDVELEYKIKQPEKNILKSDLGITLTRILSSDGLI